jgi:[acyl-carrier-protein] S-malonyltransferase
MRVGVVFPGQGSQKVGMGADLVAAYPSARTWFDTASSVLGYDLLDLCANGPDEKLRETQYSQPAIFVVNVALAQTAIEHESLFTPVGTAGHSFAEFCSLVLAGAMSFETALALVNARGLAMQSAAERERGAMSAILGLQKDAVLELVREASSTTEIVAAANFNQETQIVVSGHEAAVRRAEDLAKSDRYKAKAIALNVSGAWHSPLMNPAREAFASAVDQAAANHLFRQPIFPVFSSVTAKPYSSADEIAGNLKNSVTQPVEWYATVVDNVIPAGFDLIVEFGASAVLAPMFKRIPGAPKALHVGDSAGLEKLRAELTAEVA